MTAPPLRIELLADHDRAEFDCGSEPLNDYFRTRVGQDTRRRVALCYVAVDTATQTVAGYYTLAACGIPLTGLPAAIARKLPRYPTVPAVLIGRLAVDRRFQGRQLGGVLLFDAIDRTCRSGIAAFAAIVDAKDDSAAAFYRRFGFEPFPDQPHTLFLSLSKAITDLVKRK